MTLGSTSWERPKLSKITYLRGILGGESIVAFRKRTEKGLFFNWIIYFTFDL